MKHYERICPYNDGVICNERSIGKCKKCGWDPREQRRRDSYEPPEIVDEEKAKEFIRDAQISRWRDGTYGKSEVPKNENEKY